MNLKKLIDQLKAHEGFSSTAYKCTADRWTIGYGRNISDKGISEREAQFLLDNDIQECYDDLLPLFINFELIQDSIQHVLLDMRFQLGAAGFRKFKKMITAVNNRNQEEMIKQMRDSSWYTQVKTRADNLIRLIEG